MSNKFSISRIASPKDKERLIHRNRTTKICFENDLNMTISAAEIE
jgi:hypothetical protein